MHKLYFIDVNYFVINSNKDIDNPWGLYEVASNFMHVLEINESLKMLTGFVTNSASPCQT